MSRLYNIALLSAVALTASTLSTLSTAQIYASTGHDYLLQTVVQGLEHPWSMAFLPSGNILVTERPGRLRLVVDGALQPEPVRGLPDVTAEGQGGLLDLALHPNFEDNGWLYFTYSHATEDGGLSTHLARGQFKESTASLSGVEQLFIATPGMRGGRHFGGRLVIDNDHYVYLTVGDRGTMQNAQNLTNHAGTTIRLHDDGRVPDDNPFVNEDDALDEIFTWGNRNGQGMVIHPETGAVWQHEHGPRGGDEINLIQSGLNYGWPEVTHGVNYNGRPITEHSSLPGVEDPLLHWTPSIAPSGMAIYTGDLFPQWTGDVFVGALVGQRIQRVRFDGTEVVEQEDLLVDFNTRIRDVRDGPDGTLWLLTDEPKGRMMRFVR
ncbi:MAG: PQQ-dependent sugar dehydrogenase [Natronospirillum sp.]